MLKRLVWNDIRRSKGISSITMIFVAVASMLSALAVILLVNLTGAIDHLMEQAKTPHLMQMHSGTLDMKRLENFASQNSKVDEYQLLEFLNVEGSKISIGSISFSDNVQDNGFCTQSESFDYLLDLDGHLIEVKKGEVYVPICYMKDQSASLGDTLMVGDHSLTVAGFLRDSQMNSLLASSKRFLVNKEDFEALRDDGSVEYLIEFRLKNLEDLDVFESEFTTAGIEGSGPIITYPLFKMINAISDGLMIGIILLVSVLVVIVALLCIRFTLLTKIEDDTREIGVLKGLGVKLSDIKRIYLAKYAFLGAIGCLLGFVLAWCLKGELLEGIRLYMGEATNSSISFILGSLGILLIFAIILLYVNGVLRRFRKISAANAIRFGTTEGKSSSVRFFSLSKNKLFETNIFLGLLDVLRRKKLYGTMLLVLIISTFIMIVPTNLYSTISSEDFIRYMGIGNCNMRMDLQQTDRILEKGEEILTTLRRDPEIDRTVLLTTQTFNVLIKDGKNERIKIELGDHTVFPVEYSEGHVPTDENEIALSTLNAEGLEKKLGDILQVEVDGNVRNLQVSGIYSDITNGGKTAKACFVSGGGNIMWSILCVEVHDGSLVENKVNEYSEQFPYAKVFHIEDYVTQTFGGTLGSVKKASEVGVLIAVSITFLITVLFIKMLILKDRHEIALLKALGYSSRDIRIQFISRSIFVLIIAAVIGTVMADTIGESMAGLVITSLGAASFRFIVNPLTAYIISPVLLALSVLAATYFGTRGISGVKINEGIKE